jgi:hypothetical protein
MQLLILGEEAVWRNMQLFHEGRQVRFLFRGKIPVPY